MKINVIFLGAGPTALAGIREVGEYNLNVYVIGVNKYETSLFSKYTKSLGYADPLINSTKLKDILLTFAKEYKTGYKNILIPTGDDYIEFLSNNKTVLKDNFNFSLLENDLSKELLSKELFYELCVKYNLPAPKTWNSVSNISLEDWAENALYPCFIKPVYYHKWAKVYGLKKGFEVSNKVSLLEVFKETSKNVKELVIQEIIEGDDDNLVIFSAHFDKNSKVSQCFTGRKLRQYPVGFGTTTCARSEDIEIIKEYSIKFLKAINYRGVCDVEYKYDKRDNTYKIIEINPRIGRWYRLVTKSGKRPLLSSILELANNENYNTLEDKPQKSDIYWFFPIRDIPSIIASNKIIAFSSYLKRNKVWCIYDYNDIKPFFTYFSEIFYKVIKYKVKNDK